jgi:hypothetical protein
MIACAVFISVAIILVIIIIVKILSVMVIVIMAIIFMVHIIIVKIIFVMVIVIMAIIFMVHIIIFMVLIIMVLMVLVVIGLWLGLVAEHGTGESNVSKASGALCQRMVSIHGAIIHNPLITVTETALNIVSSLHLSSMSILLNGIDIYSLCRHLTTTHY